MLIFKKYIEKLIYDIIPMFYITFRLKCSRYKRYFRSILIWIFVLYIIIGGFSLISKKYRVDEFLNFTQNFMMKNSFQQQEKLIPLITKDIKNVSEENLLSLSNEIFLLDRDFVFLFYNVKDGYLVTPFGIKRDILNYNKIKYISNNNFDNLIVQGSSDLGLNTLYPDTFFITKKINIDSKDILVIIGSKMSLFKFYSEDLLKVSLNIDFIVIFVFFVLYILVTVFAIAPVFLFIKKFNSSSLNSSLFKPIKSFEFNHIRWLRVTLLRSFRKLEKFEAEKREMMNSLIKHQNDIDTGKMVSQIIHDLKSPLSVFEELLHDKSKIKNDEIFKKSNLALIKLHSLIENIRDPKREKLLIKKNEIFDFSKIVSEVSWFAKKQNSKITVSPSLTTPIISCDHSKLERCMQNLIRNAIYFCNTYCLVEWKITEQNELYIEVIDDGRGVSPELHDKIFDWRMTLNKVEGTGVGLTFVKFFADIHGGKISYFRRNGLTVFALLIPNILPNNIEFGYLNENKMLSNSLPKNEIKNKVIILIENFQCFEKIKSICWPNEFEIEYHNVSDKIFDLSGCFCIYTDSSSDIIEKALAMGVNVVLHKSFYSDQLILRKILQTRKK